MRASRIRRSVDRALRREDRARGRLDRSERRQERHDHPPDPLDGLLPAGDDGETRRRLLEASAELFAESGFDGVTVRDICLKAGANVAAVNYHFGDKLALYTQVVEMAIEAIRKNSAGSMQPAAGASAEERLAWYIHGQLERVTRARQGSWVFRLMHREMDNPTPALDRMVREAIRPRHEYLNRIVGELMRAPGDDPRVRAVIASIQGLPMLLMREPIVARLVPAWKPTPEAIRQLADLFTRFTLAGIRGLAEQGDRSGGP
jgi:AcrR family transcriptional regulator